MGSIESYHALLSHIQLEKASKNEHQFFKNTLRDLQCPKKGDEKEYQFFKTTLFRHFRHLKDDKIHQILKVVAEVMINDHEA